MRRPTVTMRYGALNNEITVDGRTFDRAELGHRGVNYMSKLVNKALRDNGFFARPIAAVAA